MMPDFNLDCFKSSYLDARQCLLEQIDTIPTAIFKQHQSFPHPSPGPDKQPLYLDWLQFGQSETPQRLLVLICGTHGIEGFTGSAVQCHWLPMLVREMQIHPELGVIVIHALNPWGFAWLRRYDHEGIDLNRNFINFDIPAPKHPAYNEVHSVLFDTPNGHVEPMLTHWRSRWGQQEYEKILTSGQYEHKNGLFYGGARPSWSRQVLERVCNSVLLKTAQRIAVIDLHTGLGPYAHGEVINDHVPGSAGFDQAIDYYAGNAQSGLLGESCSAPKSGLLDYFWHKLIGDRGCFVTLEFGTYSFDRLITILCQEQQYYNRCMQNQQARDVSQSSVIELRDYFYPQDTRWRQMTLHRAGQIMTLAVQGLLRQRKAP